MLIIKRLDTFKSIKNQIVVVLLLQIKIRQLNFKKLSNINEMVKFKFYVHANLKIITNRNVTIHMQ